MTIETFKHGLVELYQGEVLGEVLFDQMLTYFDDADKRYKVSSILQLETETKARLRPALTALGLEIKEKDEFREMGIDMAVSLKGASWTDTMQAICDAVTPVIDRYKEIASYAPSEYLELAESMVVHEQSLCDFANLELAGEGENSIDGVVAQLVNKLPIA